MVVETGHTVTGVARESGLNQQTLRNRVNTRESTHQVLPAGDTLDLFRAFRS